MTDKKFTDEEIIKAVEICCNDEVHCRECPAWRDCKDGRKSTRLALDLINRQKAEIERCKKEVAKDILSAFIELDEAEPFDFEAYTEDEDFRAMFRQKTMRDVIDLVAKEYQIAKELTEGKK